MNIRTLPWRQYSIGAAVGLVLGMVISWQLWKPGPPPPEAPAAAVVLPKTNAVALERNPEATPPPKVIAAAKELNPRAKVERAATVTIQPTDPRCAPMDVEFAVVKMPDDTKRIVARTDDGTITGGVDIPLSTEQVSKPLKWAAGASYDVTDRSYGVFVDRDLGPFRLSAEVRQSRDYGATALVRVGIRF